MILECENEGVIRKEYKSSQIWSWITKREGRNKRKRRIILHGELTRRVQQRFQK